jgi:hypothetical protein
MNRRKSRRSRFRQFERRILALFFAFLVGIAAGYAWRMAQTGGWPAAEPNLSVAERRDR